MPKTVELASDPLVHPLDKLRGLIRRYVFFDGLLTAGLFAILWYWIGLVLDYGLFKATNFDWVLDAPKFLRIVAFTALALFLTGILVTRLVMRLNREFSYPSLALLLEKRFPKLLGDKLITAVELADIRKAKNAGYSEEMLRSVIDDARAQVEKVPVASVFNWKRLWIKALLLGLFALGTLIVVYVIFCIVNRDADPARFASRFGDVSMIWADRNLFLQNTPWPRQAHLELVDFPDGDELRVGRDAPPPKIKVRAYQWVVRDKNNTHGWRPLIWNEVNKYVRDVPLLANLRQADGRQFPDNAATWDTDRIEATAGDLLGQFFEALSKEAAKPSNSLSLRKLPIPENVTLNYSGPQSSGKVSLAREANNVFVGEVSGLKETVRFTVKGNDFATLPKSIVLVPPPMLTRLARIEYQPAYLHHAPPQGGSYPALRGLKQTMPEKELSLTGDKTVITIIKGTEFVLRGTADKKLSRVFLKPKLGPLPGMLSMAKTDFGFVPCLVKTKPNEVTLEGDDGFSVAFRGRFDAPTANIEFDVVIVDEEGVATPRAVLVQVTDDQAPTVELAVDSLRKAGNDFLVTPAAMVPFLAESKVRDDLALGKVEFTFNASQIESGIALTLQGQTLAALFYTPPLLPTIADLYLPWATATFAQTTIKPEKRETGSVLVPRYASLFAGLKRESPEDLKAKLVNPSDSESQQVLREIRFGTSSDVFDLRAALPRLASNFETADSSVRFRVDLALKATDANIDSGPRHTENLEPIRLIVISEADLLTEMSRDEESQNTKLDEVIKKLKDAQAKLNVTADRLVPLNVPPDILTSAGVRMTDIAQDFAKAREITTGVQSEYAKLRREAFFNRIGYSTSNSENDSLYIQQLDREVLKKLDEILEKHFADLEQKHQLLQSQLGANRRPDDNVIAEDRFALAVLISAIEQFRASRGEAISLSKLRTDLAALRDRQIEIGKILKAIKEFEVGKLYFPELDAMPPIELKTGESKKILHGVNWKTFSSSLSVKFEGPGDDKVKVPDIVKVAEERNDFDYTLTAGQTPGEYKVKLIPTAGTPVTITVRVK